MCSTKAMQEKVTKTSSSFFQTANFFPFEVDTKINRTRREQKVQSKTQPHENIGTLQMRTSKKASGTPNLQSMQAVPIRNQNLSTILDPIMPLHSVSVKAKITKTVDLTSSSLPQCKAEFNNISPATGND